MREPIDDILKDCIRRLEASGGDVEAVLRSHPERADELRPYLELWASLSAVEPAEASPQALMRGRQQLLSAVREAQQAKGGAKVMDNLTSAKGFSLRILAPFVAGAAVALGIAFLTGSLDFDSGGSTAEAGPVQDCLLQLDFNHDGLLSVADIEAFRTAIDNQDPAFDLNGDTIVDVFDAVTAVKGVIQCLQQIQPPPPLP